MHALLVEDNEIFAQALGDMLADADVEVRLSHVARLSDAAAFRDPPPDVILLDLALPDAEGVDSLRGAQTALPGVPIVVLTAERDSERALQILRGGAQDYLVKGAFDADTLLRSMRYAVERAQSEQLRRRLLQADRLAAIGKLAAGVAHEISNPASFVRANQELVRAHLESASLALRSAFRTAGGSSSVTAELLAELEAVRSEIDEMRRVNEQTTFGVERICSVVADLRGYTRLEPAQLVEVRPNDVVNEVCQLVLGVVRHKAQLLKDLHEVPPIALAPGRLEQVLTNLLMNAAQAIPDGAPQRERITISTRLHDGEVSITVEDTGSGMTEEEQRHVFEPFFTTKTREEGLGLGLSICADIVAAHGGSIRCSSVSQQGSRFEVRFKVAPTLQPIATPALPSEAPASARARVLLVDDEPYIRQTYALLLDTDFDVVTAANGGQALACLEADPDIDLVICDVMMPDMDAAQMLGKVRSTRPELVSRFVLHTGGAMSERTRLLVDSGEHPVFYKPMTVTEMVSGIRRLLPLGAGEAAAEAHR
ncbi:MAG TPA: response regulator [Polyangiaceae bacterium]|nr:response regulator [Polyangiaceae bacterium]